jgi:hypothetical protein
VVASPLWLVPRLGLIGQPGNLESRDVRADESDRPGKPILGGLIEHGRAFGQNDDVGSVLM